MSIYLGQLLGRFWLSQSRPYCYVFGFNALVPIAAISRPGRMRPRLLHSVPGSALRSLPGAALSSDQAISSILCTFAILVHASCRAWLTCQISCSWSATPCNNSSGDHEPCPPTPSLLVSSRYIGRSSDLSIIAIVTARIGSPARRVRIPVYLNSHSGGK